MPGFFPAFDKELPYMDASTVDGRAISLNLGILDAAAERAGLTPLAAFVDANTLFIEVQGEDAEPPENLPPVQWYSAAEGTKTVRHLLDYVQENPESIEEHESTVSDLETLQATLHVAHEHGARFHLLIDM